MIPMNLFLIIFIFTFIECGPITDNDVLEYLEKFGYTNGKKYNEISSKELDTALNVFQKTYGLTTTGTITDEIKEMMKKPRCGMPDVEYASSPLRRNKWRKTRLTYKFVNYPRNNLDRSITRREIQRAFNLWAAHIPVTFQIKNSGYADIDLRFYEAARGDGRFNTLAFAYFPENGDVYFDEENWTAGTSRGVNLFLTAAHEFGHSLGLPHSENRNALMYPYLPSYRSNYRLHRDDIRRMQRLYGRKMNRFTLCLMGDIDAAVATSEDTVFLIKDDYCWKFVKQNLADGYPKLISDEWSELPNPLNAAFYHKGKIHFMKEGKGWIYNNTMEPFKFVGLPNITIDAAFTIDDRLYIFQGSQYWRIDYTNEGPKLKQNYPKSIFSFWKGVPSNIEAAFYDFKKYVYFFKDDVVFKIDLHNIQEGAISQNVGDWLNCDSNFN